MSLNRQRLQKLKYQLLALFNYQRLRHQLELILLFFSISSLTADAMGFIQDWAETVILSLVSTVGPILVTIFCFPLLIILKISEQARHLWFSYIYPQFSSRIHKHLQSMKNDLFKDLMTDKRSDIKILEVGVGPGVNFDYYPKSCILTLVDVNPCFMDQIEGILRDYRRRNNKKNDSKKRMIEIKSINTIISGAEDLSGIDDESIDAIICTHVLCSVNDMEKSLEEFHRVLTRNGKLYLLEHIKSRSSYFLASLQIILQPFYQPLAGNCHVTRDPTDLMRRVGFEDIEKLEYEDIIKLPLLQSPNIFGVLRKK